MLCLMLLLLIVCCQSEQTIKDGDLSEFVVSPSEIASFTYGKRQCRIWASASNGPTVPQSQWQFRYDPLFVPVTNENNEIALQTTNLSDSHWRTSFQISLDDEKARELAFQSVKRAFNTPSASNLIERSNVFSLPLKSIKVNFDDLIDLLPQVKLRDVAKCTPKSPSTACYTFDAPTTYFRITIVSPDESSAKEVERLITHTTLLYQMEVRGSREVKTNRVQVTFGELKKSKFYANLTGQGRKDYISRNDLRNLLRSVKEETTISAMIEDPDRFDQSLLNSLLERWSNRVSTDKFDELSWSSTYNSDDLKPDVITRELNKIFKYDERTDQFKREENYEASGSGGYMDITASASGKASFKKDELKKLLKQLDITVEIEGNMIVAKSVDVYRINWADFDDTKSYVSVVSYVSGPIAIFPINSFIDFADFVDGSATLSEQVKSLVDDRLPAGVVISFYGSMDEAEQKKEQGYWVCDGRIVNDPASAYYGRATPDLRNIFLRGTNTNNTGEIGGSDSFSLSVQPQKVTVKVAYFEDTIQNTWRRGPREFEAWGTFHNLVSTGYTLGWGQIIDTLPKYFSVIYLLKVRDSYSVNILKTDQEKRV